MELCYVVYFHRSKRCRPTDGLQDPWDRITLWGVHSVMMSCFVIYRKIRLPIIELHNSYSISPTAGGTCKKCFVKHHLWPSGRHKVYILISMFALLDKGHKAHCKQVLLVILLLTSDLETMILIRQTSSVPMPSKHLWMHSAKNSPLSSHASTMNGKDNRSTMYYLKSPHTKDCNKWSHTKYSWHG